MPWDMRLFLQPGADATVAWAYLIGLVSFHLDEVVDPRVALHDVALRDVSMLYE